MAMLGQVSEVWELYAVYVCYGIGFCCSGLIPVTTIVTRWFHRQRALALSVASTGLSIGGVVVTPASAVMVDRLGLATAAPLLGSLFLLGVLPSLLIVRPSPASVGLTPDGDPRVESAGPVVVDGVDFRDAIRGRYFWLLGFAYFLLMGVQVGGIAHQYGLVAERASPGIAVYLLAILPTFSIIGRLAGGIFADRTPIGSFTMIMIFIQTVAMFLLGTASSDAALVIGLSIFGISVGNLLMLHPLLIANAYGLRHYPRLYSVSNLLSALGVAAGPAVIGFTLSVTGTYTVAYLGGGVIAGMALAVFALAGRPYKRSTTSA
jgi:MFS family permease